MVGVRVGELSLLMLSCFRKTPFWVWLGGGCSLGSTFNCCAVALLTMDFSFSLFFKDRVIQNAVNPGLKCI